MLKQVTLILITLTVTAVYVIVIFLFFGGNAMGCKIFIRINTSKKNFFRSILSFSKLELRIKNYFRIMNLLLRLSIINNEINMH